MTVTMIIINKSNNKHTGNGKWLFDLKVVSVIEEEEACLSLWLRCECVCGLIWDKLYNQSEHQGRVCGGCGFHTMSGEFFRKDLQWGKHVQPSNMPPAVLSGCGLELHHHRAPLCCSAVHRCLSAFIILP